MTTRTGASTPTVLSIPGDLIIKNRQEFRERIAHALETGNRHIVLDFTGTGYVDSYGLGVMVSVNRMCREAGARLVVAGLNEDVRKLFDFAHLSDLFTITDTVGRAIQVPSLAAEQ